MRKWFIRIGILAILCIGGYLLLSFYAVKLLQPQLQKVTGPGLTLREMRLRPTSFSVRGIRYEDPHHKQKFAEIEEVRIYPSFLSLFKKSIRIKEVTIHQPSFSFYRSREGIFVGPWVGMKRDVKEKEISEKEAKEKKEPISVQVDRIRIRNGLLDFEDRKTGEAPVKIKLREFDLEIRDIRYPFVSSHSPIELKGKMRGKRQEGKIVAKGWIDLNKMDFESSLKIRDLEVETFKPYYQKKVSAEIDSGYMNLESNVVVKEKRIDAPGELDLVNLHIQGGGGTVFWIPSETLIPILAKKQQIKVPFHVKGNLEDPKFSLQEAVLTRIGFSFMEALGFPVKDVTGTLLGEPEKGTGGLGFIEELFKKKKERNRINR